MTLHHEFGPSILSSIQKCGAFVQSEGDNEKAEAGSLRHEATQTGDLSILEGELGALEVVKRARDFIASQTALHHFNGLTLYEVHLELPQVNFGTADYLRFNLDQTEALLVDLKFGAWSVAKAKTNLQLLNYAAAAFACYPTLKRILGIIWQANGNVSTRWFNRKYLDLYTQRVERIVSKATRARANPRPEDFTPDPLNCSFCARVGCPARVQLASALVAAWTKTPVALPKPFSLTRVDLDTLSALKRLCGALTTFAEAVNNEAKRRVFDEGAMISGYEIRERSGKRTLTGESKVETAITILDRFWAERYPDIPLVMADIILPIVELSVAEIEKQLGRHAPRGQAIATQKLVAETLEKAGLVEAVPQFYLAAIKT
jgi:hypothetical protein